ncbi:carboxylesterase [Talaromyces proteolyticus]|uniref:Carboxylesterase n=1 Tax=Talaromyces proteolyticus TaxID=1131652 RepID=A0AAD4KT80_9EURO|nr:carboxylesterase [Talaromyces proteolyticus]KAH8695420.1 carboxylesterase [Talaromyces proteolyticus]
MSPPILAPEWQELEKVLGSRPLLKGSPEDIISQFNGLMAVLASSRPSPDPSVETRDTVIKGINCRVYMPSRINFQGDLPLGVYAHGGGFVCGDLESEDFLCRAIAGAAFCIIVSVDYRLGPQYKLPIMLDDVLSVYSWLRDNARQFGADPSKLFSIGGSAGGGLALGIANHFAQQPDGHKHIHGVVAMVPVTLHWNNIPSEYQEHYSSYRENAENVPIIDKPTMESFFDAVNADPKDSSIFTALSPHHAKFPPTYICTCGADPLRDDGTVMEKALRKAGVPTKLTEYPNLPHYFWIFPDLEATKKFINDTIAGVKWVISEM